MNPIPSVWNSVSGNDFAQRLQLEAANRYRQWAQIPCETLEEWDAFRKTLRETLREKLGLNYDRTLPLDCKEYGEIDCSSYRIKKITFRSTEEMLVTANLYIPEGTGPFPAVVSVHGHWRQGKIAERVQCRNHLLAKNGYVVICLDAFGAGERGSYEGEFEYHGSTLGAALFNVGESLMGCQIRDNMRAVDLLCSLSCVDPARIGVTGASGGGNQTMWLAAMEDRIKASAPVVSVGTFESYIQNCNCVCEVLPEGLTFTEESAVLALAAPNAMLIMNALQDTNGAFAPPEMLRSYENAAKIFALYGRETAFDYKVFNTAHGYWPPMREAMLGFFNYHLKGIGPCLPVKECSCTCLPEEDLMVFPKGTPREKEVLSIARYCRIRGEKILKCSKGVSDPEMEIRKLLHMEKDLTVECAHFQGTKDSWARYTITLSDGNQLPLVIRRGNEDFVLLTHPAGKSAVTLPEESSSTLVALDLAFQKENPSGDSTYLNLYHDESRHLLWLGHLLMGEWTNALCAVSAWLRREFKVQSLTLEGTAETALAALFASVLKENTAERLVLKDAPASFLFAGETDQKFYNMALCIPNLLKVADMRQIAALSRASIEWITPRNMDGSLYEGNMA